MVAPIRVSCILALLMAGHGRAVGQEAVTQAELIRRVVDLDRLATPPPEGERTRMFSSYDRRSQIDAQGRFIDWDANHDAGQFLRRTDDGWDVMAEVDGPGAITRIWSANPQGRIRFVLDGEIVIDTSFGELLSGRLAPFEAPFTERGLNCYFPIGFAQSGRVLARDSGAYYHINVVEFPAGTPVERFSFALSDEARGAVADVARVLRDGYDPVVAAGRRLMPVTEQKDLGPGDKLAWDLKGGGTVRALYVGLTDRTDPREPYALHQLVLRMTFDGATEPQVEVPLVDFFGSGFEPVPFRSLATGTAAKLAFPLPDRPLEEQRFMYCYFPMPYRDGLRLEIENLSRTRRAVGLVFLMRVDTRTPAPDALRFHARYRREDPCQVLDYPILAVRGRGRIVGCVLNVDCPRAEWWGEGDDKVWIDGEGFPSYFGTGTEDYFGDAWGLHEFTHPLVGVTRAAPWGKNSAYRWHVPDAINFQKSAAFTLENWQHERQWDTYYGTLAYWYATPDAVTAELFPRLTLAELTPPGLRIPGAIEAEDHILSANWGNVTRQQHAGGAELSGEAAANITTSEPVTIGLPVEQARTVRLQLRVNPRRPFETITVTSPTGRTIGTVQNDRRLSGLYDVGIVRLEPGVNRLTVQCSRPAMLDCWVLSAVPRNPRGPEGEDLELSTTEAVTSEVEYGRLPWSAGAQRRLVFARAGASATFSLPEQAEERTVVLRLHITHGPDGGRFDVRVNGVVVGRELDTYTAVERVERIPVGSVTLRRGANSLSFHSTIPPTPSGVSVLGLDAIDLPPAAGPHVLEFEDFAIAAEEEAFAERQGIGGASGEDHLWCRARRVGASIAFDLTPAPGRYRLALLLTRSFDYGIVQVTLDGAPLGEPIDLFATRIEPGLRVELGEHAFEEGRPRRLRVEVVGKASASPGYYFGLDGLQMEPIR